MQYEIIKAINGYVLKWWNGESIVYQIHTQIDSLTHAVKKLEEA
jgi:hypothetical protein